MTTTNPSLHLIRIPSLLDRLPPLLRYLLLMLLHLLLRIILPHLHHLLMDLLIRRLHLQVRLQLRVCHRVSVPIEGDHVVEAQDQVEGSLIDLFGVGAAAADSLNDFLELSDDF